MEKEFFRIDTKGLCLFCLKDNNNDARFGSNATVSVSFKMLLRYLKINVYEICNFSPTFLQSMDALEDTEVVTTICPDCTEMMKKFSKLYQDMELIRLQLDKCVQSLYCAMQNGENNKTRADEYRRRMQTRNILEMFQANVADSLRHETMRKCSLRVEALTPRVTLNRRAVDTFQLPVIKSTVSTASMEAPSTSTLNSKFLRYDLEPPHLLPEVTLNPNPTLNDFNNEHGTGNPPDLSFNGDLMDSSEEFVVKVEPVIDELSRRMDSDDNTNCDKSENDIFLDYRRKDDPDEGQGHGQDFVAKKRPGRKSKYMNYSFPSDQLLRQLLNETEVKPYVSGGIWADTAGGSGFRCKVCGKKFLAARSLWGHLKIHKNRSSLSPSSPPTKTISPVTNPAAVTVKTPVTTSKSKKKKKLKMKRRSKCNICGLSFTNLSAFRSHMKHHQNKTNSGNGNGNCSTTTIKGEISNSKRRFTCIYCDKVFHAYTIYRTHLVSLHTLQEFSHRLPTGTTEEELTAAIKDTIDNHKPLPPSGSRKKYHYGCNFCNGEYPHPSHLRLHHLRSHFDKLTERLETHFYSDRPETSQQFQEETFEDDEDHHDGYNEDVDDGNGGDDVNVHDGSGASEEFDQLMNQHDQGEGDLDHEPDADDIGNDNDNNDSKEEIGEEEEEEELDSSSLFVVRGQLFSSEADPLHN